MGAIPKTEALEFLEFPLNAAYLKNSEQIGSPRRASCPRASFLA